MLIDDFLPTYDVFERHQTHVHAPPDRVYASVRSLDMRDSWLIRALFALRESPALVWRTERQNRLGLTLEGLLESGFVLLAENPPHELLLGLVGRFWTISGGLVRLEAHEFASFDEPEYAKAVWNFTLARDKDATCLATETRVHCLDSASRRRFGLYWALIGPFSGLIRRALLNTLRHRIESHE